ncbi:hypothetical protein QEZ54_19845 [Catellatospora sp. KI3]|uniref:EF-hand domain-containing protein n=1 Tax=Catellatospora sp. KI3 TaxID=3041620 RepID=UPI0024822312|nr:EF-hand domain-containing protein [Catellatospora sp. KI3]MDI1463238.1 hypothetical protein [Catellatospora sp. KI3]
MTATRNELEARYSILFELLDAERNGSLTAQDMTALATRVVTAFEATASPAKTAAVYTAFAAYWDGLAAHLGGGDGPFNRAQFIQALQKAIGDSETGFTQLIRPIADTLFTLIDTDDNGEMSLAEFRQAQVAMGVDSADSERAFARIDLDGNGRIDRDELVAAVADFYRNPSSDSPMSEFFGALSR